MSNKKSIPSKIVYSISVSYIGPISGSLNTGRFGYQWQVALALIGIILDTKVDDMIFAGTYSPHCSGDTIVAYYRHA